MVGLALKTGQYPAGLRALDRVLLVDTGPAASVTGAGPAGSSATILVAEAEVTASAPAPDGQSTAVSVLVPGPDAPAVAAAGARGQVSVVLLGGTAGPGGAGGQRPTPGRR